MKRISLAFAAGSVFALLLAFAPVRASAQLYAADGTRGTPGWLYRIDENTGKPTPIGPIVSEAGVPLTIGGMDFDASGVLWGASTAGWGDPDKFSPSLYKINTSTGIATFVAQIRDGTSALVQDIGDITFHGSTLYAVNRNSPAGCTSDLATINLTSGLYTCVGDNGLGTQFGLGLASNETNIYWAHDGVDGDLATLNTSTGDDTSVGTLDGMGGYYAQGEPVAAMTFIGTTLYGVVRHWASEPVRLVTINTATGAVTEVGILPPGTEAIAYK